jgi:hypothetical protein
VTSYSIARRTSAIGVCIALGARRADILERHLNDISSDPVSLAPAVAVLFTSAVAAVLLSARRAMRIDPIGALREERADEQGRRPHSPPTLATRYYIFVPSIFSLSTESAPALV